MASDFTWNSSTLIWSTRTSIFFQPHLLPLYLPFILSHPGFPLGPWTCQILACLWAFAHAVSFLWTTLPQTHYLADSGHPSSHSTFCFLMTGSVTSLLQSEQGFPIIISSILLFSFTVSNFIFQGIMCLMSISCERAETLFYLLFPIQV